ATNLFVFVGDAAIVSVPFVPHVVRRIRAMPVSPAIQYASRVGFGGETAPKGSRREVGGVGIEVIQHREEGPARGFLDPFQEVAVDFGRTLATGQVSATRLLVQLDE